MKTDPRTSTYDTSGALLSVVVPAYNEEAVLPAFHQRLSAVLEELNLDSEVLYVSDGSTDSTADIVRAFRRQDARVGLIELSRNFGKELAMTAGLDHAKGSAVVVIDADLQDPPELIPELIAAWRKGFDVVYAKRSARDGESLLKRATAHSFYRLIRGATRFPIPEDTGDYRLLSRRALDALLQLREQHRFMKGLFAWIGFPQQSVEYRREARHAGSTKFDYWRLWNFALDGFTSFTTAPLKIATYIGVAIAFVSFAFAAAIIYRTLRYGDPVAGYPSLATIILFLGGVQLAFIGLLGEYLARMFDETKRRPLYLVKEHLKSSIRTTTGAARENPAEVASVSSDQQDRNVASVRTSRSQTRSEPPDDTGRS